MHTQPNEVRLYYPEHWQVSASPEHEALRTGTLRWGLRKGVVELGASAYRNLSQTRSDLATVLAYPTARGGVAQFISDFIGWYLLLDDALESVGSPEDLAQMPAQFDSYLAVLSDPGAFAKYEPTALLRGAQDLGARLGTLASPAWRRRFCESMRTYFYQGVLPEITHRARQSLPSLTEYVDLRIDSSGSYPIFDLIELATGQELPDAVASHPLIRELRKVAAITISWANDVLSFHKEWNRKTLNLTFLLTADCGLSKPQALNVAVRMHDTEMRRYLVLKQEASRVPALDDTTVETWLSGLDTVMRGLLEWQFIASRYTEGRGLVVGTSSRPQELREYV